MVEPGEIDVYAGDSSNAGAPAVLHRERLIPADRVDTVRRCAYGVRVSAEGPQVPDQLRAEAERHIAEHALGEAERIARLSRIREFVLGAQDGLLVPLGVVTGMAAANPARSLIIVAGLAEAVAGAISMGGGSYLASQAEEQLYASEIASEGREIAEFPERETAELALILEREGLTGSRRSRSPEAWPPTRTSSCARRSRRNWESRRTRVARPSAMPSRSASPISSPPSCRSGRISSSRAPLRSW